MLRARGKWKWLGLVAVWGGLVSGGMSAMWRYSATPGQAAIAPAAWPGEWTIRPATHGTTLIVTLHPKCSCSEATLGELADLLARNGNEITTYVLIVRPQGTPRGWEQGDLWKSAAAIPGVNVMSDPDGQMASQLGAFTSGQTYAFDSQGRLLFSGGITSARAHMGDNAGVDSISAIALQQEPLQTTTPVYGCPLEERKSK
jgi:hypothetical protein